MLTTSVVNEREWRTELSTCSFQFSPKTCQIMPLYAYLTPKIDFKRKFNHHQSFLYEWQLTARTIRKFRIGPSLRIESRIGRTIRNRIESRSFAGPYWTVQVMWRSKCAAFTCTKVEVHTTTCYRVTTPLSAKTTLRYSHADRRTAILQPVQCHCSAFVTINGEPDSAAKRISLLSTRE